MIWFLLNVLYLYILYNHTTDVLVSLSNFSIISYFILIQLKKNYVKKYHNDSPLILWIKPTQQDHTTIKGIAVLSESIIWPHTFMLVNATLIYEYCISFISLVLIAKAIHMFHISIMTNKPTVNKYCW